MRIINKKYLLIILLVGVILTDVILGRPKENAKLDNVVLKQEVNNKTFAMYKEDDDNNYVKVEDNKFPDMYVLNLTKSKCIDNNGNELEDVLSYENDKVTITSGNTTYCYLYFDKSLGLKIKEENPQGLSTDIKGAMYRFQGQQIDNVNNYICFGTSDKDTCTGDTDHYMYRIIGIEAETGRVKVIKKEALKDRLAWADNDQENIEFPNSKIYESINGYAFLENSTYVPEGWIDKISNNTWMYGDMDSSNVLGANQSGEELYKTETGQKETLWYNWADKDTPDAIPITVDYEYSEHKGETVYYTNESGKWVKTFNGKVSLMYLHDYYYSVSDGVNCHSYNMTYEICKTGWMHLSQNDTDSETSLEWTMSRFGWYAWGAFFRGHYVNSTGGGSDWRLDSSLFVRPVFFINALQTLKSGDGTITDPFIIKS